MYLSLSHTFIHTLKPYYYSYVRSSPYRERAYGDINNVDLEIKTAY